MCDINEILDLKVNVDYKDKSYEEDEQETRYREQILMVFKVKEFNDVELSDKINQLYEYIRIQKYYQETFKKTLLRKAGELLSEDPSLGFLLLHSFDTFDIVYSYIKVFVSLSSKEEVKEEEIVNSLKSIELKIK